MQSYAAGQKKIERSVLDTLSGAPEQLVIAFSALTAIL